MKKFMSIASVLLLALTGCGSNYSADDYNAEEVIKSADLKTSDDIEGKSVDMIGMVVDENMQTEEDGPYYTVLEPVEGDPINDKYITDNVEVYNTEGKVDATLGDYVEVTGVVTGVADEDNYLPGIPMVEIVEAKPLTETQALSPALKTVDVNKTETKSDVTFTLKSIEFSPVETRLNVTIDNQTNYEANISDYDTTLIVDGKNYESGSDFWSEDTVELPSTTYPKSTSEGVISFPPLDYKTASDFKLVVEGDLDDDDWTDLDYSIQTTIK